MSPQSGAPSTTTASSAQDRELLALLMEEEGIEVGRESSNRIGVREDSSNRTLSFSQERLWMLDQLHPGQSVYNVPVALRLDGPLDISAMRAALTGVLKRHEVLRTEIRSDAGTPKATLAPVPADALQFIDLSKLPDDPRQSACEATLRQHALEPFDLSRPPLLRGLCVRLGAEQHVVMLTLHHIASDAWSVDVLLRELSTLYNAAARGNNVELLLPELPIQYADYAHWQRSRPDDDPATLSELKFWRETLDDGRLSNLELPTDYPRPVTETFDGGVERIEISGNSARLLRQACAETGTTPFMFLLAVLDVLLHRYSGQEEVVVGTPVSGRNRTEIEPLVGFFLNTLVLRNRISPQSSFRQFLAEVRRTTLDAFEHQSLPFERLVRDLQPQRDLSRSVLFQVMFTMNDGLAEQSLQFDGLRLTPVEVLTQTSKFDLTLSAVNEPQRLLISMEYNRALFDADTIRRMLAAFEHLLHQILADSLRSIDDYEIVNERERATIAGFNATARDYDLTHPLRHLILDRAQAWSNRIAVSDADGASLTYSQLIDRVRSLAWKLHTLGVARGELVGVCVERSVDLEVAVLGTMLSGAAYIPMDPGYPLARLSHVASDAKLRFVLCHEPTLGLLAEIDFESAPQLVRVDQIASDLAPPADALIACEPGPRDLAYVIYTSGSTGTPKGAMNEHVGFFNRLSWMQEKVPLTDDDVVLQKAPIGFDVSVWDFFWPLLSGARLHMARPGGHRDPEYLRDEILAQRVTTLHFVPSMLSAFLSTTGVDQCGKVLRRVMVGGEALSYELKERFFQVLPGVELHNQYGPSEASVDVTHHACAPAGRSATRSPNRSAGTSSELAQPLHDLIADRQDGWIDQPAVSDDDGTVVSYRELSRRSEALASHLRGLGVAPGELIGVCVQRSVELEVALLGILKSGCAYVPLDPDYPAARLSMMLRDAHIRLLICHEQTRGLAKDLGLGADALVHVDQPDEWRGSPTPPARVSARDLAYMIYTSGSTGVPKGAMNEHRGIVNRLLWMQETFGLNSEDVVLQKTPASFDVSVWEFFWPLLAGSRLHMARPNGHQDPAYLAEVIQAQKVTTLHFVPSMLSAFLQSPQATQCNRVLKRVICSGEALGYELKERFFRLLPNVQLHNLYGPTEAAVDVTHHVCRPGDDAENRKGAHGTGRTVVPIGRPVANTQIHILDGKFRPLPIGVPGELHIGGVQVGRGYFNRPELTSEKFIADPFDPSGAGRLYKTGDLARWLPSGEVEFLGRLDFQVKIRGQRIELGEVESALMSLPIVKEAAAAAVGKVGEDQRLVGYLVLNQDAAEPGTEDLRTQLSAKLPSAMIPSQFVFLNQLPLSSNGKLDRKNLPQPSQDRAALKQMYVAPRNPVEEALAEIWRDVLKLPQVGVQDNFFALGGDSIMSLQIIARANARGLKLAARDIFQRQTIATLAEAVSHEQIAPVEQGPVVGPVPLLPIQAWFLSQEQPDPSHYNHAIMLQAARPLSESILRQALDRLIEHHDALRLRVVRQNGQWQQSLLEPQDVALPLRVVDLADVDDSLLSQAIEQHATEAQESLQLDSGRICRAVLFRTSPGQPQRLLIVIHHMAVDGMSWRILLEDLQTAYAQLEQGQAVQLPAKTASIRNWAQFLKEHAANATMGRELEDWCSTVGAAGAIANLGNQNALSNNTSANSAEVVVTLEPDQTQRLLRDSGAAYQTQINDLLLAALSIAYRTWTGSSELIVDLEGHGREHFTQHAPDVSRTVGWFTSLYPVSLALPGTDDIGQCVMAVKERLRAVPNNGIGFGMLRYLGAESARGRLEALPRPRVCFNYLGQLDGSLDGSGLLTLSDQPVGPSRSPRTNRPWLLELNAAVVGKRLRLQVTYNRSVHQRTAIESFVGAYRDALSAIIDRCADQQATRHTPSDFALAGLDQDDLDKLSGLLGE